ncbi:sensor histidine kinase [Burkholderia sp. WSM2232]|uniref:sensor histidine kinase n=1 Tax=Burkholderia sp. WSM2232 TaxID=944436 RepID=UPI0012EC0BF9|nr:ATP-binding protein [Burkholderia sp. WSM2232]
MLSEDELAVLTPWLPKLSETNDLRRSDHVPPAILDDVGLVPALMWLVEDFRERSGLSVILHSKPEDAAFNDDASTAIFRIVQEGLTNVVHHAKGATQVVIELTCTAGMCDLSILDNGQTSTSLSPRAPGRDSSGLAGIRQRTRHLGGSASIAAHPEGGFMIQIWVPRRSVE